MAKLLDISVSEGGVIGFPSVESQRTVERPPTTLTPEVLPTTTRRQPQLLDVDVSEAGIVEGLPQQIVEPPSEERDLLGGLTDLFTGESRTTPETEAAPEFGLAIGAPGSLEEFGFKLQMLVTATDDEKKNLIRKNIPGVKIRDDDKGNTFVTLPDGRETILNRPGFSFQDAANLAADVVTFWPAARIARLLKPLFVRALVGGAGAAVTETGRQVTVQQLGGREEISLPDIALAGGVGVVGEALVRTVEALGGVLRRGAARIPGLRRVQAPGEALGVTAEEGVEGLEAVRAADIITEETGIPLFKAQKILVPS